MKKIYCLVMIILLCSDHFATAQIYRSQNISMLSNWFDPAVLPEPSYGIKYNGIWGWADPAGNEYAIIGSTAGTYFVNVTNPASPVQSDFVASRRDSCIWHEIKTYEHYCYIVSDDVPTNSLQIVDMSYLPDSVHVVYDSNTLFETSHTIWIDGNKLYGGYVRGGSVSYSAMAVFDISNPVAPVLLRKVEDDYPGIFPYAHDMYVRNDTIFASCGYAGLFVFKLDSTNHFQLLASMTSYPNQGYNHSSALTDDGHTLIFCEEVPDGQPVRSVDVSNLGNMTILTSFESDSDATPHNPFIMGNILFLAYYQDGLQVYDISNPSAPVRLGYFDTHWQNDALGNYPAPADAGCWGAYPWLPSGNVIASDMQNGLYTLDVSTITGVKHHTSSNQILIYPNPSVGNVLYGNFSSSLVQHTKYEVINMEGQLVERNFLLDNQINIEHLTPGIYSLRLISDEVISVQKFVRVK